MPATGLPSPNLEHSPKAESGLASTPKISTPSAAFVLHHLQIAGLVTERAAKSGADGLVAQSTDGGGRTKRVKTASVPAWGSGGTAAPAAVRSITAVLFDSSLAFLGLKMGRRHAPRPPGAPCSGKSSKPLAPIRGVERNLNTCHVNDAGGLPPRLHLRSPNEWPFVISNES